MLVPAPSLSPLPALGKHRMSELEGTRENIQSITIIPWMGKLRPRGVEGLAHSHINSERRGNTLSPPGALLLPKNSTNAKQLICF